MQFTHKFGRFTGAKYLANHGRFLFILVLLAGCAAVSTDHLTEKYGASSPSNRVNSAVTHVSVDYHSEIKPILDSRCVVCHGCYDAPCQLNLSSIEGIERGMIDVPVYNGTRLFADDPTRLYIDEHTTEDWRSRGFYPVLNEYLPSPTANLDVSVLYKSLALKQANPLPKTPILDNQDFKFTIKQDFICPPASRYREFAKDHPLWGMPYALPAINPVENSKLTQWLKEGALMPARSPDQDLHLKNVDQWETFFNQPSLKAKLVNRYLYEHLFLANIHFDQKPNKDTIFYKLVRSSTAPGEQIKVIATRRPNHDPKVREFYYRLQRVKSSTIAKTHLPYRLDEKRMETYNQLFFTDDYQVAKLPGYENEYINPFKTFSAIPPSARYMFLLDEAKYFIEGFIKGPVCRGQRAVTVINDHFWVFFVDPLTEATPAIESFVNEQAKNLRLPGEEGSNALLLTPWLKYASLNKEYLLAKKKKLERIFGSGIPLNEHLVWDGENADGNAALTIFRNFDNASVIKGLIGEPPKTAWIIDYPLLERIHYLLTVDFDVYGNVGHQLNTRLYMDFLRMEGELNFLLLLPKEQRQKTLDHWYRDADNEIEKHLAGLELDPKINPSIEYVSSGDSKLELYQRLRNRVSPTLNKFYDIQNKHVVKKHSLALTTLQEITGKAASFLAEHTNLVVEGENGEKFVYTVLANRAHSNITSLFNEKDYRLPSEDTITVSYGILGDYPNAFWSVQEADLPALVAKVGALQTEKDYEELMNDYGIRRTSPQFWAHSDLVHQLYQQQQPTEAAILDYNRIENR